MTILEIVLIVFIPVLFAIKIIYDTRGACFFTGHNSTDNEKVVRMGSEIKFWDWPSKMHDVSYGRGQLREYWVMGLHLIGKFFKNRITDHRNIVLAVCANCVSSILIYFIIRNYFGPQAGLISALLYITCLWPYQVAVYMGHIHLAQMFFLAAVFFLQLTETAAPGTAWVFFFLAGMFSVVSFASSSASRKYPPVVLVAALYALRDYLAVPWYGSTTFVSSPRWMAFTFLVMGLFTLRSLVKMRKFVFIKKLRDVIKKDWPESKYNKLFIDVLDKTLKFIFILATFCIFFVKDVNFFLYAFTFGLGAVLAVLHLLLPTSTFLANINRYSVYLNIGQWANHFNTYKNQEKTFGQKLPENFRGAGLPWIPRFFGRVMPVVSVLFVLSVFAALGYQYGLVLNGVKPGLVAMGDFLWLLFVSLLPIITVELTKGLQVGKSYMPSLVGLLFFIGYTSEIVWNSLGSANAEYVWWGAVAAVILGQFLLSLKAFYQDILPARMAPKVLRDSLHKLNIREFYTYDNPYNEPLVKAMVYGYPDEFTVHYVNSIAEVKSGTVVVPGVSAKSVQMETNAYAVEHGDFTEDQALNQLLKDRNIEKLASAKIRMMGCSKIYVHESEITSFRDLILKQISDHDRWLSHAWVLPASAVSPAVNQSVQTN